MEIKGKGNVVRWRKEKYGNPENIKIQRIKRKLSESGERKKVLKRYKKNAQIFNGDNDKNNDKTLEMKDKRVAKKTQHTDVEGR